MKKSIGIELMIQVFLIEIMLTSLALVDLEGDVDDQRLPSELTE